MLIRLRTLALLLFLVLLAVVPAGARVSGELRWNLVDFQRDVEGTGDGAGPAASERDFDANSFLQTYSLLYEYDKLINHGRAGEINLALGYEWTSLAVGFNDEDEDFESGKLLYKGNLTFAPGGLPLRLQMYSVDQATSVPILGGSPLLVPSGIYYDLANAGTYRQTGITLWAGIKNGSYLGQYREVLSQLPKLLLDYEETTVRDLEGLTQSHWRMRDLAFVSLNKKDNWFHYRVTEYENFLDSEDNYEERVYMLGTVDHTLTRQWINLTNWVQLSVDGSLTQLQDARDWSEDGYVLNLFTKAQRRNWQAGNFTSMERTVRDWSRAAQGDERRVEIEKNLSIPVFASGDLDSRTRWRMTLNHNSEERLSPGDSARNEHTTYIDYQLEKQQLSGELLMLEGALDIKRGTLDNAGQAARFVAELRTDHRRNLPTTWLANYQLSVFNSEETGDLYNEQGVRFAVDHRPHSRLRYGGSQYLALGFGDYTSSSTEYLRPSLSGAVANASNRESDLSGTAWRSTTDLYVEVENSSRWRNRVALSFDYIDRNVGNEWNLKLGHTLGYSGGQFRFDINSTYETGDEVAVPTYGTELGLIHGSSGVADHCFSSFSTVEYSPLQNWLTAGKLSVVWAEGDFGRAGATQIKQRSQYALFSSSGQRSKIMDLEQELYYEFMWGIEGERVPRETPWYSGLRLAATFYPYQLLTVATRAEYRYYGALNQSFLQYGISAEVPFQKLQIVVAYDYGQSDNYSTYIESVTEHRWEVDIKKTF